jgi:single-strand DNA-binding protein
MARKSTTTAAAPEETVAATAEPEAPANDETIVVLRGFLVRNPELRHTPNGTPVIRIRVGQEHEDGRTTYHEVVAWKATAIAVCEYLKKGREIEAQGRMRENRWTDANGQEHVDNELNAFRVEFISTRSQTAAAA